MTETKTADEPEVQIASARMIRIHYLCMLCGHEPTAVSTRDARCPRCGGNLIGEVEFVAPTRR